MSNDGFRIIIDRRAGRYYWSFTWLGEQVAGTRGHVSPMECAQEADDSRRQLELAVHFKKQKQARAG